MTRQGERALNQSDAQKVGEGDNTVMLDDGLLTGDGPKWRGKKEAFLGVILGYVVPLLFLSLFRTLKRNLVRMSLV